MRRSGARNILHSGVTPCTEQSKCLARGDPSALVVCPAWWTFSGPVLCGLQWNCLSSFNPQLCKLPLSPFHSLNIFLWSAFSIIQDDFFFKYWKFGKCTSNHHLSSTSLSTYFKINFCSCKHLVNSKVIYMLVLSIQQYMYSTHHETLDFVFP